MNAESSLQEGTQVGVAWRMKMKGKDLHQIVHSAISMLRQGKNANIVVTNGALKEVNYGSGT